MAGTGKAHLREGDIVIRVEDLVMEFPIGHTGQIGRASCRERVL